MNALDLESVHFESANGTDLTVGLAEDATWEGASSKTEGGIEFIANVPHRGGVLRTPPRPR